mmetsp:Transcript_11849/g.16551  ORF Transcript_11849/g.16551 Transcript_11849/m.16551 type:complete len:278 (+) Transcript_11849:688-1521(+)
MRLAVSFWSYPEASSDLAAAIVNAVEALRYSRRTLHFGSEAKGCRIVKRVDGGEAVDFATFRMDSSVLHRTIESSSFTPIFKTSCIIDSICLSPQAIVMSPKAPDTLALTVWLVSSIRSRRTCATWSTPSLHSEQTSCNFSDAVIFTSGSLSLKSPTNIGNNSFPAISDPSTLAKSGDTSANSFLTLHEESSANFKTTGHKTETNSFVSLNVFVISLQILTAYKRIKSESSLHTSFSFDIILSLILFFPMAFERWPILIKAAFFTIGFSSLHRAENH